MIDHYCQLCSQVIEEETLGLSIQTHIAMTNFHATFFWNKVTTCCLTGRMDSEDSWLMKFILKTLNEMKIYDLARVKVQETMKAHYLLIFWNAKCKWVGFVANNGSWSSARNLFAQKICSTWFFICSTPFEQ